MRAVGCWALVLCAASTACASSQEKNVPIPSGWIALRTTDLEGRVQTLGQLRGRVVLVTVINTWADPALYEVPLFKRVYANYTRSDLEIVCIALDDSATTVQVFRDTFEIPYPVVMVEDRARFVGQDGPLGPVQIIPSSFLLTRGGEIALRMDGTWSPKLLIKAIDRLVARDQRNH
jgi:hypothetical protein